MKGKNTMFNSTVSATDEINDIESFFTQSDMPESGGSFYPSVIDSDYSDESNYELDLIEPSINNPIEDFVKLSLIQQKVDVCAIDSGVINLGTTDHGSVMAIKGSVIFQENDNYSLHKFGRKIIYVSTENRIKVLEKIGEGLGKPNFFIDVNKETGNKTIKSSSTSQNQFQDRIRNYFERKLQKWAISKMKNSIILIDGSLTTNVWDTPLHFMQNDLRDFAYSQNNCLVAVSKKSTVEINGKNISYLLDDSIEAGFKKINSQERSLGTIFAVRFSLGGLTFRVDICPTALIPATEDVLKTAFSNCRMSLGYPFLLKLAHIHSIFTKNEFLSLQVYAAKKYSIKLKRPIDIGPIFAPFSKR